MSHTENQFKCTQCEKSFRHKHSLVQHIEYHTGLIAKPFVCDVCRKGFRINANLVEHRRIHTGEKPFTCEHCALNFRTMSSYYSHLKKLHGLFTILYLPFSCLSQVLTIFCCFLNPHRHFSVSPKSRTANPSNTHVTRPPIDQPRTKITRQNAISIELNGIL